MLLMAVGIKLAIQYSGDQALGTLFACMHIKTTMHACVSLRTHPRCSGYKRSFAWLLTGSLGTTLITMNISRVCHKLRPLIGCGKPTGRYAIISAEVRAICDAVVEVGGGC